MIRRTIPDTCDGRYYYDPEAAQAGYDFFCEELTLTIAEWAGDPFIPSEEQEIIIRDLFGWKCSDTGYRRFRVAYVWVPRKWGKSEFAAGIGLLLLLGDDEPGAQVYCLAETESQANIVYDRACAMIVNNEDFSAAMVPYKSMIWYAETASKMEPLTGKPKGKHGLAAVAAIGDEMHEWSDDELYTFVHQSEGNRRQPLDFLISTAGKKQGPGWEMWKLSEALLDGSVVDETAYVFIAAADAQRDKEDPLYWTTEECWAEANPNYPITPKPAYLRSECAKAMHNPRKENNFKKYHLNLWVEQDVRWLNMNRWDQCAQSDWRTMAERMKGRECVVGIDISAVSDLTCANFIFPPCEDDDLWRVMPVFWIPEDTLEQRIKTDKQAFDKWKKSGAVITTPGDVVDQRALMRYLVGDPDDETVHCAADDYVIRAAMIDRWNATQFAIELTEAGVAAQLFGQGYGSLSGPSKWLEKAVLGRRFDHGGHPVLRWNATNVAVNQDSAENIKPDKEKSTDRIDGIVALVMGVGGCDEYLTPLDPSWEVVEQ